MKKILDDVDESWYRRFESGGWWIDRLRGALRGEQTLEDR